MNRFMGELLVQDNVVLIRLATLFLPYLSFAMLLSWWKCSLQEQLLFQALIKQVCFQYSICSAIAVYTFFLFRASFSSLMYVHSFRKGIRPESSKVATCICHEDEYCCTFTFAPRLCPLYCTYCKVLLHNIQSLCSNPHSRNFLLLLPDFKEYTKNLFSPLRRV